MAGGVLFVLFLLFGLGSGLVLYWLVSDESTNRPVMDREAAERMARRDTDDEEERW